MLKTILFLLGFCSTQFVYGQDINAWKLQGTWQVYGDSSATITINDTVCVFSDGEVYQFEYAIYDIHRNQISILHHYATLYGKMDTLRYIIDRVTETELHLTNRESKHGHFYIRK